MFIGHFGVGLAAKKIAPELNLGILFVACQLLDLIWPILVLAGIEQVAVDPAATAVTPLDFFHYPYSHSLVMTLFYSLIGAVIIWKIFNHVKYGLVAGLVILSHWILDFITHRPDLPIFLGEAKFGLGLWNSVVGTLVVEVGIFVFGILIYLRSSPAMKLMSQKRRATFWSLIAFLLLIYFVNIFGPKPPIDTSSAVIAGPALAMWLIIIWGYYADRVSVISPKTAP